VRWTGRAADDGPPGCMPRHRARSCLRYAGPRRSCALRNASTTQPARRSAKPTLSASKPTLSASSPTRTDGRSSSGTRPIGPSREVTIATSSRDAVVASATVPSRRRPVYSCPSPGTRADKSREQWYGSRKWPLARRVAAGDGSRLENDRSWLWHGSHLSVARRRVGARGASAVLVRDGANYRRTPALAACDASTTDRSARFGSDGSPQVTSPARQGDHRWAVARQQRPVGGVHGSLSHLTVVV